MSGDTCTFTYYFAFWSCLPVSESSGCNRGVGYLCRPQDGPTKNYRRLVIHDDSLASPKHDTLIDFLKMLY